MASSNGFKLQEPTLGESEVDGAAWVQGKYPIDLRLHVPAALHPAPTQLMTSRSCHAISTIPPWSQQRPPMRSLPPHPHSRAPTALPPAPRLATTVLPPAPAWPPTTS